jgi:hypothetical protein
MAVLSLQNSRAVILWARTVILWVLTVILWAPNRHPVGPNRHPERSEGSPEFSTVFYTRRSFTTFRMTVRDVQNDELPPG